MEVNTIGLDLAKNVFQVHGIDAVGDVVVRRALRRAQLLPFFAKLSPCLVGIEACGTSHHWARELIGLGHEVRLMPPAYVKPYVKRGKNDVVDAEAICEAVRRPTMRFVAVKSREQQSVLSLHRARSLLVEQRTQLVNMMRNMFAEKWATNTYTNCPSSVQLRWSVGQNTNPTPLIRAFSCCCRGSRFGSRL